jgi:hypothetical protein
MEFLSCCLLLPILLLNPARLNGAESTQAPPSADRKAVGPAAAKALQIIIPQLQLRDASLSDTLAFLSKEAQRLDPEQKGVDIVGPAPAVGPVPTITISLRQIPLWDTLKYVAELTDLQLIAEAGWLKLQPSVHPARERKAVPFSGPAMEKAQRVTLPGIDFRQALISDVLMYLTMQCRMHDKDREGVNIVLLAPANEKWPLITLSQRAITVWDALLLATQQAGLELSADKHALCVRAKPKVPDSR